MSNNHISSNEFITLCQSQIMLLAESLGAVWSIVYLAEEVIEGREAQLLPMAIYPQTEERSLLELPTVKLSEIWQQLRSHSLAGLLPGDLADDNSNSESSWSSESAETRQIVLPLIHQETFLGLLVTGREDREWFKTELKQAEEIARTLAIARFLELQYHWTQDELTIQENLRQIERDRLDNLIHQLRNPLTALRTFSKLLLKRVMPGDRNHRVAKSLLEQSDRFQQLLEQFEAESTKDVLDSPTPLLDVSDNTNLPSNFLLPSSNTQLNPIDLTEILEPLLNTARAIATERNIQLKSNIPPSIPEIKGDLLALREIFNNLIDNALKYTPSGGKVELDVDTKYFTPEVEMLGIVIGDTGCGIPQTDRERLFERHYRGIQAQSNIPGTGLGLAIAQELVKKMQGEIELISPNNLSEDHPGTTFIVWLPVSINNE